ncbi:MAG: phosphatidylinositol-specific phospholipase C domain-containing protein, partial [SAR324 cluster bacterium]|nr:phosphatidylinositol-specific phospholipase C domain-containing protein [SAR324 cluster bacterium]
MAEVSDSAFVADLSIPGTHYTATFNTSNQFAKCQSDSMNFINQLQWGVRAFDLRLSENMNFFHGNYFMHASLNNFLADVTGFLAAHPSEFVIAFVSNENCDSDKGASFNQNFQSLVANYYKYILIDKDIQNYRVGDLRGKIVIITRNKNPYTCGWIDGAPMITWPDNTTNYSTAACSGCMVTGICDVYHTDRDSKMFQL